MHVLASLLAAFAVGVPLPAAAPPQRQSPQPVVVSDDGGFHWGDAAIGAAAGFGTALVLHGTLALRRSR